MLGKLPVMQKRKMQLITKMDDVMNLTYVGLCMTTTVESLESPSSSPGQINWKGRKL